MHGGLSCVISVEVEQVNSIQIAARQAGVTPNLIRAWEHRYGAVEPGRTSTKRRLYSQADIERLRLLKQLTNSGHAISHIAKLPDAKLRELLGQSPQPINSQDLNPDIKSTNSLVNQALIAIQALDAPRLEKAFENSAIALGTHGSLLRVIAPLAETVGELWRAGHLSAAHEHFGSTLMRKFLLQLARPVGGSERSPVIVIATPAGQLHELGALLAAATATHLGWQVTQLGASLPAAEIALAARQKNARAVALSLIYPEDDSSIASELALLKRLLPVEVALIAGGRAAKSYRPILENLGATFVPDLSEFGMVLDQLRRATT